MKQDSPSLVYITQSIPSVIFGKMTTGLMDIP